MIPMCWKCASAKWEHDPEMPGVKNFVGCVECPQITDYDHAKVLCPLVEQQDPWHIEPCDNPIPDTTMWQGQWFRFHEAGTTPNRPSEWGWAHHSTLHMYVGEELAKKAIDKAVASGIMEA